MQVDKFPVFLSFLIVFVFFGSTSPSVFGRDIFPFLQHTKWGFIDEKGKVIIPAQYNDFGELSEGLIAVHNGKKWGFIDSAGNVVIDFQFDNPNGITENNPKFSEGLACVQITAEDGINRYGFIDKSGKFIIKPKYKHAFDFSNGLAAVLIGRKYAYINKAGLIAIKPQTYHLGSSFSEGLATIATTDINGNDEWGYIDTTGKIAIQPQFDRASDFYEERATVKINGKLGVIDKNGKIIVQPIYDQIGNFSDGLALVAISDPPLNQDDIFLTGKWGYIDKFGNVIIPISFFEAKQFSEGLACVNFEEPTIPSSNTSGFIDRTGKIIFKPQFTTCTRFERGIAEVGFKGGNKFINKAGDVIWSATYEEMHSPKKERNVSK